MRVPVHAGDEAGVVHLFVAFLLRTQHELLLGVEQALSGLRLARHHQLRREVAGSRVRLCRLSHRLSLQSSRNLLRLRIDLLCLGLDEGHVGGLRGALPALVHAYGHEVVPARRR